MRLYLVENTEDSDNNSETVKCTPPNGLLFHTMDNARFPYGIEKRTGTSTY